MRGGVRSARFGVGVRVEGGGRGGRRGSPCARAGEEVGGGRGGGVICTALPVPLGRHGLPLARDSDARKGGRK